MDYVLLSRDADGAPRFVDWFYPSPQGFDKARRISEGLATAVSLDGGYADQTHFSTRRWYDEHVFPLLPEGGTCMEHVLHPAPVAVWKSKVHGAFVDLHAIDATPARWRGGAGSSPLDGASTAPSPRNDFVKNYRVHPTHWLISTQHTATRRTSPARRRADGVEVMIYALLPTVPE